MKNEMNDKFWALWRKTVGTAPGKKHETLEDAKFEANRLSSQSGESYFILEVIGIVEPKAHPVEFKKIE